MSRNSRMGHSASLYDENKFGIQCYSQVIEICCVLYRVTVEKFDGSTWRESSTDHAVDDL